MTGLETYVSYYMNNKYINLYGLEQERESLKLLKYKNLADKDLEIKAMEYMRILERN